MKARNRCLQKVLPDVEACRQERERARSVGARVVLIKGVFDLLHAGHVRAILAAGELGDYLIVAVATDEIVTAKKGAGRPIIGASDRLLQVAAIMSVDVVFPSHFDSLEDLLRAVQPDVFTASHFGSVPRGAYPQIDFVVTVRDGVDDTSAIISRIRHGVES